MTSSIANRADAMREGLARGYLSAVEAIEWARLEVIRGEDDHAPLLADLVRVDRDATANILRILGQLAWGAEPERVGRIAAGHLHERLEDGRLDPIAAAALIHQLIRDGYAPDAAFESGARRFGDETRAIRPGTPLDPAVRAAILEFLANYRFEPTPEPEPVDDSRDQLTITVEREVADGLELTASLQWQAWSGRVVVRASRENLADFAPALRDFSAHAERSAAFSAGDDAVSGLLRLTIAEQGRVRRAIATIELRGEPHPSRAPEQLSVVVPTEHALVGEFAADLAELAAVGAGTARLRLVRRWPDEP